MATFNLTLNNEGGRQEIAGRLYNHHKALINIKSAINSR